VAEPGLNLLPGADAGGLNLDYTGPGEPPGLNLLTLSDDGGLNLGHQPSAAAIPPGLNLLPLSDDGGLNLNYTPGDEPPAPMVYHDAALSATLAASAPAVTITAGGAVTLPPMYDAGEAVLYPYLPPDLAWVIMPADPVLQCDGTYTPPLLSATVIDAWVELPSAGPVPVDTDGAMTATLPPATTPALGAIWTASQNLDLPDADGARAAPKHQHGQAAGAGAREQHQQATATATGREARHQHGEPGRAGLPVRQQHAETLADSATMRHQRAEARSGRVGALHTEALRLRAWRRCAQQAGIPTATGRAAGWQAGVPTRRRRDVWHQDAGSAGDGLPARHQEAIPTRTWRDSGHHRAKLPDPGRWWPFYELPNIAGQVIDCAGGYTPRPWSCWFILSTTGDPVPQPPCDAVQPDPTFVIPIRRFYVVSNSAQIVRVFDGLDVPASAVSLSTSVDSIAWEMSATIAGKAAFALLEGTDAEPVEVDVMINGETWRILVDSWRASESFGQSSVTVRGRSRSAYLAAPYATPRDYIESQLRSALQLADQELPPGWSLNWTAADWNVPAGAWRYAALAPIDAISKLAAAAGGYVAADQVAETIHVRPLYPSAPWEWSTATPAFQVPRDILTQRSSDKRPGDAVNGVYVHGGSFGGILAHVIRQGTVGDTLATTIVDDLITDPAPARARGVAAISATMRQATESYELPLDQSLGGLIEVGSLIEAGHDSAGFVADWRGMVRGATVTAGVSRASNGGPQLSVRQSLEIERHFEA